MSTIFIIAIDEYCASDGDDYGGLPNDDGAEDDNIDDDGDDGRDRATRTTITTRITQTMIRMMLTTRLQPMLTIMGIGTMIERIPR